MIPAREFCLSAYVTEMRGDYNFVKRCSLNPDKCSQDTVKTRRAVPRPNISSVFVDHLLNSLLYCITLCPKEEDQETALRDERQQGDQWYGV